MGKEKIKLKNVIGHLKTVCTHKYWVFHYCRICGIPWRGIKHDLSKFSPTEFFESVRYYTGTSSPINLCKQKNHGVSRAWLHHKGRNLHHYEYWQEIDSGTPLDVPFIYTVELLCDYLGAGNAYQKKNFTYIGEYKWFLGKIDIERMHVHTKTFVYTCLELLASLERRSKNIPGFDLEMSIRGFLNLDNLRSVYKTTGKYTEEDLKRMRENVEKRWKELYE